MRPAHRHYLGMVGAAVVGLVGLVALSSPSSASPLSALIRIRTAPRITNAAGTAHVISDALVGHTPRRGAAQRIVSVGDVEFSGPAVSLVTRVTSASSADAVATDQIVIGTSIYLRSVGSGPSGAWSKGSSAQAYPYLGVVEPAALSEYRGPVTTLGADTVNGQPTVEYALRMPGETRTLTRVATMVQHVKVKPFILDVWLSRSGVIVRTSATQTVEDDGTTVVGATTVTLSRFGEPIHIVAPHPLVPS